MKRPLRDLLDPAFDADDLQRVHERLVRSLHAPRKRRAPPVAYAAALLLTVGLGVWALALAQSSPVVEVATPVPVLGPLWDIDRSQAFDRLAAAEEPVELRLDDTSTIVLSPGTSIDAISNTGEELNLVMSSGVATFDVTPGGPRRWSIDASWFTVDVLGTQFSIERRALFAEVRVARGVVRVHGAGVPGGLRRLGAGDSVRVQAPLAVSEPEPDTSSKVAAPNRPRRHETSWRRNVANGAYREAFEELERHGFTHEVVAAQDAETLLLLADAARLSGHPSWAVAPLHRLFRTYPNDPRAGLAAFTLGRVEHESLDHPAAAVAAFERALELGLPPSLERPARLRIEEAQTER